MARSWLGSILFSFLIHALLVVLLLPKTHKPKKEGGEGDSKEPSPPQQLLSGNIVSRLDDHSGSKCVSFYGGIGIYTNPDDSVEKVFPGYPAAKAGIVVGDVLSDLASIRGEVGVYVEFDGTRNGTRQHYRLKRDKVCIE